MKKQKSEATATEKREARLSRSVTDTMLVEVRATFGHHCTCQLHPGMTFREINALGAGCTAGQWVCPCLDALRRRLN